MSTAVIWSNSKPEVEFQYGGRLGEFNGLSSQSHATLQGERIPSAMLKIVFSVFFCFLNAVWDFASGGFRIVFDTLVSILYIVALQLSG